MKNTFSDIENQLFIETKELIDKDSQYPWPMAFGRLQGALKGHDRDLDTALQTLFYQIQKQTQPKQISG